jgi:hypothetical protein
MAALPDGWHAYGDTCMRDAYGTVLMAWRHGTEARWKINGLCSVGLKTAPTLPEACAAAERAYCGCYVGKPVARPVGTLGWGER